LEYLVGGFSPTPLKNMSSSSLGMMTFPTEWKNNIHVPNHQPGIQWSSFETLFMQLAKSRVTKQNYTNP